MIFLRKGEIFYRIIFLAFFLGVLNFGCGKPESIESIKQESDPQPQPSPTTAYIDIYANEMHGDENITGTVAELWQNGIKVVEGTLVDGYVQLKLTKNLIPNSSGQYDFGNYKAIFTDGYEGYVDVVSPSVNILVTEGGSTEMLVKMVNESDINVHDYRYLWRQQPGNWRYEGPSEIVVNLNQNDLAGTGKKFNSTWMDNFKKIFREENIIQEITCGYITNITYNEDTNVGHGDPGTDGIFNMLYNDTLPTGGVNADYPYNGPASDQKPVLRGVLIFNPEKMPDSHSYQGIFHEFFDDLFRLDQDYVASVPDQTASRWSFGSLNGSELLEGYENLTGWVEVVNGNGIVTGYRLMTLNPDYREFEPWDPFRHGITPFSKGREPKYEFRRIEPEEGRHTRGYEGGREKIKK